MTRTAHHDDEASRLVAIRRPRRRERRDGAEIVFVRQHQRRRHTVLAAVCYKGWQQWGEARAVLSDNVVLVEAWRRGELPGFPPPENDSR